MTFSISLSEGIAYGAISVLGLAMLVWGYVTISMGSSR